MINLQFFGFVITYKNFVLCMFKVLPRAEFHGVFGGAATAGSRWP